MKMVYDCAGRETINCHVERNFIRLIIFLFFIQKKRSRTFVAIPRIKLIGKSLKIYTKLLHNARTLSFDEQTVLVQTGCIQQLLIGFYTTISF